MSAVPDGETLIVSCQCFSMSDMDSMAKTPLLPAESVGFSISLWLALRKTQMASSRVVTFKLCGVRKPFFCIAFRNRSLCVIVCTTSYGLPGNPIFSCTYAAMGASTSEQKGTIPSILSRLASFSTASLLMMSTLQYSSAIL